MLTKEELRNADMDIICKNCKKQKEKLFTLLEVATTPTTIATLGPIGTTSYNAALYFRDYVQVTSKDVHVNIDLYENFDLVFKALLDEKTQLILMPNAYNKMTEFYWNKNLEVICSFLLNTPSYGIASHNDFKGKKDKITLATCKAVEHIIPELWNSTLFKDKEYEIVEAYSTKSAMQLLVDQKVDLALTNSSSLKKSNLKFISETKSAEVLWSVFTLSKDNGIKYVNN